MDPWLVQLEKTLSAEKFGKFFEALFTTCRHKRQLLWWMEREWEKLVERNPEFSTIDPLASQPLCYLHRQPLHEESLKIVYGYFDPAHVSLTATECPFGRAFVMGPDWGGDETERVTLICPQCRGIYNRKHKNRRDEQVSTGQPATRPVDEPEGGDKPQPEAEGRSR